MTHGLYFFTAAILAALAFVLLQLSTIGRHLMATQADIDKLTAQVIKVRGEIQNIKFELAGVKEQLAANEVADKIDISGLEAAIQSADDENADVVVDVVEDVEDAPVDVPVEDAPAE